MAELTVSSRNLSVDDAPKIAAAISQLEKIGLKPLFPEREFPRLAREMAEEFEGTGIPEPPLPLTWVDLALSGPAQVFANAIHFQDHCFDVAGEADYLKSLPRSWPWRRGVAERDRLCDKSHEAGATRPLRAHGDCDSRAGEQRAL